MPVVVYAWKKNFLSSTYVLFYCLLALLLIVISQRRTLLILYLFSLALFMSGVSFGRIVLYAPPVVFILGMVGWFLSQTEFGGRFGSMTGGVDGSIATRLFSISANIDKIKEQWILGYGFGSSMIVATLKTGGVELQKNFVDNSIVVILFKVGIVGLTLFGILLWKIFSVLHDRSIRQFYIIFVVIFSMTSAFLIAGQRLVIYLLICIFVLAEISRLTGEASIEGPIPESKYPL